MNNERIEKLAERAFFETKYDDAQNLPETMHRFAELIVKECSKVIVNGGYRNPAFGEKYPLTPPEIATMIQEHFGVEE